MNKEEKDATLTINSSTNTSNTASSLPLPSRAERNASLIARLTKPTSSTQQYIANQSNIHNPEDGKENENDKVAEKHAANTRIVHLWQEKSKRKPYKTGT